MYITVSISSNKEVVPLQQPIDNRSSGLSIGVSSVIYWVGYHNVSVDEYISIRRGEDLSKVPVAPGLYNCTQLGKIISDAVEGAEMKVSETDGLVALEIPSEYSVLLSPGLKSLIGLEDEGWFTSGKYVGDRVVDFVPFKAICIFLDELSTTENVVDGSPAALLDVIPVGTEGFGRCVSQRFSSPAFKRLQHGIIGSLSLRIEGLGGEPIDNHSLPIIISLEIK